MHVYLLFWKNSGQTFEKKANAYLSAQELRDRGIRWPGLVI